VRPPRFAAIVLAGALTVSAVACSPRTNGRSSTTVGQQTTLTGSKGYTCHDPKGDISTNPDPNVKGTLTQPSGIDILVASTLVTGDELQVKFQTAGPIADVAQPLFDVESGDLSAATAQSFELRAQPIGDQGAAGQWAVTLHTFQGTEKKTELSVPVVVDGNTLSYSVPLSKLPPILSLQWQFGTSSEQSNGSTPFDDCNSFTAQASSTTS
jgi:hypothetical protein